MSKTLRVGFVMGGGVSLGSFSGAALAETLKQLLLFAQYKSGEQNGQPIYTPYDRIELDVFSGASAGAVSLAIMLRALVNHRDKSKALGYENYMAMRDALEKKLLIQFGEPAYLLKQNNARKWESLVAVQAMQDIQERIWVDEVNMEKLLGVGEHQKDLSKSAGLVDRNVIDELAKRYFQFQNVGERLSYVSDILGRRMLFACTLANLKYTLKKNQDKSAIANHNEQLLKALNDSSVEKIHREVRVFDLNFRPILNDESRYFPLKWVQYHQGEDLLVEQEDAQGKKYGKFIRNLDKNDVWREIASTAIASAAFPLAFEPVVLNRYQHEFAENWATELQHLTKYPFTYVDGGMFNNEPIREALRLAAYIDATNKNEDFDRQIIFVDPNVSELENQFQSNVHSTISTSRSLLTGKASVSQKSTLMRLAGTAPSLLAALLNEAKSAETSKISQVVERFGMRDQMRQFYRTASLSRIQDKDIIQMRETVKNHLDRVRKTMDLPQNVLQIQHELLRVIKEESAFIGNQLPVDNPVLLLDKLNEFVYIPTPSQVPNVQYWVYVLSCLALDAAMDLVGKTADASLVPIAPFNFYKNDYSLMSLPGGGIAGFAGFASHEASVYEVQYGKYCAQRILRDLGLIRTDAPQLPLPTIFNYNLFDNLMKKRLEIALMKRIKEMIPSGFSTVLPFVEGFINDKVRQFIDGSLIAANEKRTFEFRIRVPQDVYNLRGFSNDGGSSNKNTIEAVRVNGEYFLLTQLRYDMESKQWTGMHVNQLQKLFIDRVRLFENEAVVALSLPEISYNSEAYHSPHPVFIVDVSGEARISGLSDLPATRWQFYTEITPLDETLWGQDNLRNLFEKIQ